MVWNHNGVFKKCLLQHMKRFSILLIVREVQIKISVRYYFISITMAMPEIIIIIIIILSEDVEKLELSSIYWECKMVYHCGKQFGGSSKS